MCKGWAGVEQEFIAPVHPGCKQRPHPTAQPSFMGRRSGEPQDSSEASSRTQGQWPTETEGAAAVLTGACEDPHTTFFRCRRAKGTPSSQVQPCGACHGLRARRKGEKSQRHSTPCPEYKVEAFPSGEEQVREQEDI